MSHAFTARVAICKGKNQKHCRYRQYICMQYQLISKHFAFLYFFLDWCTFTSIPHLNKFTILINRVNGHAVIVWGKWDNQNQKWFQVEDRYLGGHWWDWESIYVRSKMWLLGSSSEMRSAVGWLSLISLLDQFLQFPAVWIFFCIWYQLKQLQTRK